jgi:hypothetical protein
MRGAELTKARRDFVGLHKAFFVGGARAGYVSARGVAAPVLSSAPASSGESMHHVADSAAHHIVDGVREAIGEVRALLESEAGERQTRGLRSAAQMERLVVAVERIARLGAFGALPFRDVAGVVAGEGNEGGEGDDDDVAFADVLSGRSGSSDMDWESPIPE